MKIWSGRNNARLVCLVGENHSITSCSLLKYRFSWIELKRLKKTARALCKRLLAKKTETRQKSHENLFTCDSFEHHALCPLNRIKT